MTNKDRCRFDMLIKVANFRTNHGQRFPKTSPVHDAFGVITAEVEQLQALDVAEGSASDSARAERKAAAHKALVDTLTRAGKTARVLGKTMPQIDVRVALPASIHDLQLLTTARRFASEAEPFAAQFAVHGMVLDEVQQQIDALDAAYNARGIKREEQRHLRARIKESLDRAMDAVDTLDVTVANHLKGDEVMRTVWKGARRIEYPRRSSNGVGPKPEAASGAPDAAAASVPTPAPAVVH
jgi:hypothetical protein